MHNHHRHARGVLEWMEQDEIGRIAVPTPLRNHGVDPMNTLRTPKLGQYNREIHGDWLVRDRLGRRR
jgi:hypothetical protein